MALKLQWSHMVMYNDNGKGLKIESISKTGDLLGIFRWSNRTIHTPSLFLALAT